MLTVYGIPNCDTVKKTLDWFKTHNIAYQFHDYRKEAISAYKLKEWLAQEQIDKILNKNTKRGNFHEFANQYDIVCCCC